MSRDEWRRVSAERTRDLPHTCARQRMGAVYLLGARESVETPMVSQMEDFTSSRAFRVAGPKAFAEAGITHNGVDHLMIYDAPCSLPGASFAHLPIYGLEDLGFVPRGEAGRFIAERNTAPGVPGTARRAGRAGIPLNTDGRGPSYTHHGSCGTYALRESGRQMRGQLRSRFPAQDLGLRRRRRVVRRVGDDHHVR
jgi:hypothetical protein